MLVKTLFFYIAITLEAFIFCFAGEYLSNKVSTRNHLSVFLFFYARLLKRSLSCVVDKMIESIWNNCSCENKAMHKKDVSFLHMHLSHIRILEQNDWRCCIWMCLVYSQASGLPHSTICDNEIAKTTDDHCGEVYGFIVGRIHKCKISIMELELFNNGIGFFYGYT